MLQFVQISEQVRIAESAIVNKWAGNTVPADTHRWHLEQHMDYLDVDNEARNPGPKEDPTCETA